MVHPLQFRLRNWIETLASARVIGSLLLLCALSPQALSDSSTEGMQYLRQAESLYQQKEFFQSARYAFAALEKDPLLKPRAYAWISQGLIKAGLPHAASYFFIRTLQLGDPQAIRSVLSQTQALMSVVGPDVLRKYLVRHTRDQDYDLLSRSNYLYVLAKDALLAGEYEKVIERVSAMSPRSLFWPFALQLRASAQAILGRNDLALSDFKNCEQSAWDWITEAKPANEVQARFYQNEALDLSSRCQAGVARTLYQMEEFAEAELAYDRISKKSLVWPEILFEQAWNSFGKEEYNRTLGKLVSYKSPALSFVFNSEVDVLRAQTYLALCLYEDANLAIQDFYSKYNQLGIEMKNFVEGNSSNLAVFYEAGKKALRGPLHQAKLFDRVLNRFVRAPYFQRLVAAERQIEHERQLIARLDSQQSGVSHQLESGFPGFLEQVHQWRMRSLVFLGGAFVKNSLIDHHEILIGDFEKISFIRLEMIKLAREKLMAHQVGKAGGDRVRGSLAPERRNDQFQWSFNGEFWNDELGDYVFALESKCQGK